MTTMAELAVAAGEINTEEALEAASAQADFLEALPVLFTALVNGLTYVSDGLAHNQQGTICWLLDGMVADLDSARQAGYNAELTAYITRLRS